MSRHASWLELEQLALGAHPSLPEAELDDESAQLLEFIRSDRVELPPLPASQAASRPRRSLRRWLWLGATPAAAAAALVVMVLVRTPQPEPRAVAVPSNRIAIKGGAALELELVRSSEGSIAYDVERFSDGDRFKVLLTCAPAQQVTADLVIYQSGQAYYPLPAQRLHCGNRVPMPGAFRLTGTSQTTVCVAIGDHNRDLSAGHPSGPSIACSVVAPAE